MSGWVDCRKSMPPDNFEVLAFGDLVPGAVGEIKSRQIQCAYYSSYDREWVATGDIQYGANMKSVTHWHPLPNPPEE